MDNNAIYTTGCEELFLCPVCGEKTLDDVNGLSRGVPCKCEREQGKRMEEEENQRVHKILVQQLRDAGTIDPEYENWTFAADDNMLPDVSDTCRRYVENWEQMRDNNLGVIFYGSVGTGKSFYAACIGNALLEKLVPVIVTTLPRIIDDIQSAGFGGKNEVLDRLKSIDLLVLDDLGIEYGTDYKLEQIYTIIDTRYRSGKPLIVTTNLNAADLKNTENLAYHRIYDRILQNCIPVKMTGQSRRAEIAARKRDKFKEILGL